MQGEVLEVDCSDTRQAVPLLREMGRFAEVALYGSRIHVVTPQLNGDVAAIQQHLTAAGVQVHSVAPIRPSLEDVFISQVRARAG